MTVSASSMAFVPLGPLSPSSFLAGAPAACLPRQHARGPLPRGHTVRSTTGRCRGRSVSCSLHSVWDMPSVPRAAAPGQGPGEAWGVARGPQREKKQPAPVPTVAFGDSQMDVFSRLAKDRILVLGRQVDDETANQLVAQMLFLSAEDPTKDITLYINSPGGSVSAGLAIFDTMQYIPCDVATICFGTAASMGAFLLCAGKKGKRKSLPNSRIMIHQPLGGAQGQAADIEIQAKEILFIRALLNGYIANATGQPVEKIRKDSDRDFFLTPEEAVEYGLIDEVIQTRRPFPKPAMPIIK